MSRIKLFSIDQAERALPLVRRIVGDIVKSFRERETRLIERQQLPLSPPPGSAAEERALKLEQEMEQFENDIRRYSDELQQIGVELKDLQQGLIDFYSRFEGRIVYLCWKHNEGDTLAWWHDLHAGFRGRQPITPDNRSRFRGLEPGERFIELS
ncbi:MAG TPA: DUF2203 domain-containing protein [Planctomycetota bacterium]|nr:DUF2203 domain-containing protein [Planctomycetota bacterium]